MPRSAPAAIAEEEEVGDSSTGEKEIMTDNEEEEKDKTVAEEEKKSLAATTGPSRYRWTAAPGRGRPAGRRRSLDETTCLEPLQFTRLYFR